MKTASNQLWYPNGTIGHTDEKGQLVLPKPLSKDEIEKLVRDATDFGRSTMETDCWLDDIHSDVFSPSPKDDAKALVKKSDRSPDRRNNAVVSTCQKGRAVPLLKDLESDRLTDRTNTVIMEGRAGPLAMRSHRSTVEKYSAVRSPCQRSPSPEDRVEPLVMESDRSSEEKDRVVRSPCQMSSSPEDTAHPLIMVSDCSSDAKHGVVRLPYQRSPSPEDSPELLITELDRSTSRKRGVVKSLPQESPRPEGTTKPLIMKSDGWAGEKDEIFVSPSPKNSAYAASIHRHSKEYPGYSDSSSDSDAEAMEPIVLKPAYLRPEALRSASTISRYSLQGAADRLNGSDRSPSLKSVDRPPTADSEPHPPTQDKPEEVVVAALSDAISPISPKHPPLADDIPLVELRKDAPFVDFDTHLQHRKQRLRDARAVFAMPGGDESLDGGGSLGSGEARRGFSYLDNGTGNLPAKPSCGLC